MARPYVPRSLAATALEALADARVVALLGPRQAGKSTLARKLASDGLHADYLTLDDEDVRSLALGDPRGFVAGLGRRTVIDEIQRAPDLLLAIKARVDLDDAPGQFLITGSANLRRIATIGDALPGRVDYLTLWPFTQGEIARRREAFLEWLFYGAAPAVRNAPVGRDAYAELLLAGGFPEARRRTGVARARSSRATSTRSSSGTSRTPRASTTRRRSARCCGSSPRAPAGSPATTRSRATPASTARPRERTSTCSSGCSSCVCAGRGTSTSASARSRRRSSTSPIPGCSRRSSAPIGDGSRRTTRSPACCSERSSRRSSSARRRGRRRR